MSEQVKRPGSVWAAQIIIGILILMFAAVGLTALVGTPRLKPAMIGGLLLGLAGFITILVVAFRGLARRYPYARWMTVVLFLLMSLNSVARLFIDPNLSGPSGGAYRTGYIIGSLIFVLPLVSVALMLIFSGNVSRFFAKQDREEPGPPPVEEYSGDITSG
jgi:hypothetical protein